MELTEDEIIEKYGEHCGHCNQIHYYHTNMNELIFHVITM